MTSDKPIKQKRPRGIATWLLGIFFAVIVIGALLGPVVPEKHGRYRGSAVMQTTRILGLAMFQYAHDNGGRYPSGKSSTEAFQKLIDGNYISDPAIFFLPMHGKKAATTNRLTAENVCYDMTANMTDKTPGDVPCVFVTGYKIEYRPGGRALKLNDRPQADTSRDGIVVTYHNNNAYWKNADPPGSDVVPAIIPASAKIGPGPYTQLCPEGPLDAK